MSSKRAAILFSILKGLLAAIVVTLVLMLLVALLTVFARLPDYWLIILNQMIKIVAIALGTRTAVGRGGRRGFVTGVVVALAYMILGYTMYVCLGGGAYSTAAMLGEMLLGATIGGIVGAILANMNPKPRRGARSAAASRA